jgi:myosin heavy subunit
MICKDTWPGNRNDVKTDTKTILASHKLKEEEFRFGKTKIFLRNPTTVRYL